jgi:phosphohistidine swiveling domain-containing protein
VALTVDVDMLKARIIAQAGDDWIEFPLDDGRVIRAPRTPFLHWALGIHGRHLLPDWEPVAPFGLKMQHDDPYHSDWMIGAGIDLWSWHGNRNQGIPEDDTLINGATNQRFDLQITMLDFKAAVLSGTGRAQGYVMHPKPNEGLGIDTTPGRWNSRDRDLRIVVIPHAGPEYVQAAIEAHSRGGAVITERGGAMAHLVNVGREQNVKIVRVEGALKLYPDHMTWVTVDCDRGRVIIRD